MKKRVSSKTTGGHQMIDPALLESAKRTIFKPTPPSTFPCKVCGEKGATEQSDSLCWVCRRLKISAWREIEQQIPLSE